MPPVIMRGADGKEHEIMHAFMGAEGRYEDWVYLIMLEREWKRPLADADRFLDIAASSRPAARSVIAIIFWSYFETRIERLFREAMRNIRERISEHLLERHSTIGSRLDRLYQIVFGGTYFADLVELGFPHVAMLLKDVQTARNDFAHGSPQAITDTLIETLIGSLKDEHESWIAVFNKRAAWIPKPPHAFGAAYSPP
jgi:hypothetical protein